MGRMETRPVGLLIQPRFESRVSTTSADAFQENDFSVGFGSSGVNTIDLPLAASFPGRVVACKKINDGINNNGTITVNRSGADTIEGATTFFFAELNRAVFFQSDGAAAWRVISDYSAPNVPIVLTDAATIAINAALGGAPMICDVTLAGNRTLGAPTNPTNGRGIILRIKQDGTGNRTLAYNAIFRFPVVIPSPTLSTAAGAQDKIAFQYDLAANKWDCVSVLLGYT